MKILFCNITYMNQYIGNIEKDKPRGGGAWVKEHEDAHEKWNFLNCDGMCYGFVMNPADQFHIERIDKSVAKKNELSDVTVVWCANNESGKTVIVGWYENATVYRFYQDCEATPVSGIPDRCYFTSTKAENAYLLPESLRTFEIGRASKLGSGKGFGQQNYWYAESDFAQDVLIPEVVEYISRHREDRINRLSDAFERPWNYEVPLTHEESQIANEHYDNGEYFEYLPYGYRYFYSEKSADSAYYVACALRELHQYSASVEWYKKVIGIEGNTWDIDSILPYMYMQCGRYEESLAAAQKLFEYENANAPEIRHEIYSIIADDLYLLDRIKEAITWLDKIIVESTDTEFVKYTKGTREYFTSLL